MIHSPGPWKPTKARFRYGATGIDGIEDANGRIVLRIDEETWSETESTKYIDATTDDMALILAAPRLLATLKTLLKESQWFTKQRLSQYGESYGPTDGEKAAMDLVTELETVRVTPRT